MSKPKLTILVTDNDGQILDCFDITSVRDEDTTPTILKLVREIHEFEFNVSEHERDET
jgi:hypothetical protein